MKKENKYNYYNSEDQINFKKLDLLHPKRFSISGTSLISLFSLELKLIIFINNLSNISILTLKFPNLLRLSIKQSKNSFITKYTDINNNEHSHDESKIDPEIEKDLSNVSFDDKDDLEIPAFLRRQTN